MQIMLRSTTYRPHMEEKKKKMYQDIIKVIDNFFYEDPQTAEKLREAIKSELGVKRR